MGGWRYWREGKGLVDDITPGGSVLGADLQDIGLSGGGLGIEFLEALAWDTHGFHEWGFFKGTHTFIIRLFASVVRSNWPKCACTPPLSRTHPLYLLLTTLFLIPPPHSTPSPHHRTPSATILPSTAIHPRTLTPCSSPLLNQSPNKPSNNTSNDKPDDDTYQCA